MEECGWELGLGEWIPGGKSALLKAWVGKKGRRKTKDSKDGDCVFHDECLRTPPRHKERRSARRVQSSGILLAPTFLEFCFSIL